RLRRDRAGAAQACADGVLHSGDLARPQEHGRRLLDRARASRGTHLMARKTLAVIAARGGSKGIPHKNLLDLCGKPLIAWTVEQARAAHGVDVVAVSSDSDQILAAVEAAGAVGVRRPDDISGDLA